MSNREIELCYYAEVTDRSGLEQATDTETHEQWEYVAKDGDTYKGKQRVRSTTRDGQTVYHQTIKVPMSGETSLGAEELDIEITKEFFDAWVRLFGANGCVKERYVFLSKDVTLTVGEEEVQLPSVKFEVDILLTEDGKPSRWCKIDVEIDHLLDILAERNISPKDTELTVSMSTLPFAPKNIVAGNSENPEVRKAIDGFWARFSRTP